MDRRLAASHISQNPRADLSQATHLAERVRVAFANRPWSITCGGSEEQVVELMVTASIGVAIFRLDGSTTAALLEAADRAMYQAKQRGGNRVCCLPHVKERSWKEPGASALSLS